MSTHMRKNINMLRVLYKAKPKLRKVILKHVEPSCIQAICDVVLNVLKSVVKLSPTQKRKIAKHKHHLRLLVSKATSLDKRRRVLVQKGDGFLTLVLGSVLKELGSLIG